MQVSDTTLEQESSQAMPTVVGEQVDRMQLPSVIHKRCSDRAGDREADDAVGSSFDDHGLRPDRLRSAQTMLPAREACGIGVGQAIKIGIRKISRYAVCQLAMCTRAIPAASSGTAVRMMGAPFRSVIR